jgi:small conductance mechanosensitive channel
VISHPAPFVLAAPLLARRVNWELDLDLLMRGAAKAVVILVVAYLARWALHRLSHRITVRAQTGDPATAGARVQRAATLAQLLNEVGLIVIVIVAGLLFLDIFINITPLLAGAGVLGVAASLGGQAVMKDIVSGFLIVFEDQYAVGDRVRIGAVEGTVQQLTLRSTVIRSDDGTLHFIANGSPTEVANLSRRNVGRTPR